MIWSLLVKSTLVALRSPFRRRWVRCLRQVQIPVLAHQSGVRGHIHALISGARLLNHIRMR